MAGGVTCTEQGYLPGARWDYDYNCLGGVVEEWESFDALERTTVRYNEQRFQERFQRS